MGPIWETAAEQLLVALEEVDAAIATHLKDLLGSRRWATAREIRTAVLTWCTSAEARAQYDTEVLDGAAYALGMMDDALFLPLVRDLLSRDVRPRRRETA